MVKQIFLIIVVSLFLFSCITEERSFYIELPVKDVGISVITRGNNRYLIDGNYTQVPDTNYVQLDISNVSKEADEIGLCWGLENVEWKAINYRARVITDRLDSTRFLYEWNTKTDELETPSMKDYTRKNCLRLEIFNNIRTREKYRIFQINGEPSN